MDWVLMLHRFMTSESLKCSRIGDYLSGPCMSAFSLICILMFHLCADPGVLALSRVTDTRVWKSNSGTTESLIDIYPRRYHVSCPCITSMCPPYLALLVLDLVALPCCIATECNRLHAFRNESFLARWDPHLHPGPARA